MPPLGTHAQFYTYVSFPTAYILYIYTHQSLLRPGRRPGRHMSSFFHAPFGDGRAVLHVCIVSYSISLANLEHLTTTHAQFSLLPGLDSVVDRTLTSMLGSKMWRFPLGKRKIFEKKIRGKKFCRQGDPLILTPN